MCDTEFISFLEKRFIFEARMGHILECDILLSLMESMYNENNFFRLYMFSFKKLENVLLIAFKEEFFEFFKFLIQNEFYKKLVICNIEFENTCKLLYHYVYSNKNLVEYIMLLDDYIPDRIKLKMFNKYESKGPIYPELYKCKFIEDEMYKTKMLKYINNKDTILSIKFINNYFNIFLEKINHIFKISKLCDFDESQYENLIIRIYDVMKNNNSKILYLSINFLTYIIKIGHTFHSISKIDEYILLFGENIPISMLNYTSNIKIKYLINKKIINNKLFNYDTECNKLLEINPKHFLISNYMIEKFGFSDMDELITYLYNFSYDVFSNNAYKNITDKQLKYILCYICPFLDLNETGKVVFKNVY